MPTMLSDGVEIWFDDLGAGDPVVLLHGWGSSAKHNFGETGWIEMLSAGYRVIAMDCRGHGRSAKPHRAELYGREQMAGDVIRARDTWQQPCSETALQRGKRAGVEAVSVVACHSVPVDSPAE